MDNNLWCSSLPDKEKLLAIICAQADITKAGPDLSAVMSLVAQKAMELTGAQGAAVELSEGDDMVYRAVAGNLSDFLGLRLKREGSMSGRSVSSNEILCCENACEDSRVDKDACIKVGAISMVCMPLTHESTCVGVLKVTSPEVSFFTNDSVCMLSLISNMLSSAIYYAARYAVDDLIFRATRDPLTGLPNRAAFFDNFRKLINSAGASSKKLGLLMVDMDGLKYINDTYGHRAGDAAITGFADILRLFCAHEDIARLGGDEFAIIINELKDISESESIMESISGSFKDPITFEDHTFMINASMGLAVFPDDAKDIQSMMEFADKAMYAVKKSRKTSREFSE